MNMNSVKISILFASLTTAHYAIKSLVIDGNFFPARDARLDEMVGAKRINGGIDPKAPTLIAPIRAGANVTFQWTDIVRHHDGPAMSYLGAWPTPDLKPQQVDFFKFYELGYNSATKLWANEVTIKNGYKNTVQLPSDIKPGKYILRTDLLSLHGNGKIDGPQFYTHCLNVEISGSGIATPAGVKFPGGYGKNEPGVVMRLGNEASYDAYKIPGPPKYNGKFEQPEGPPPVVGPKDIGAFPPEFQAKYEALAKKYNTYTSSAAVFFDYDPKGGKSSTAGANPLQFFTKHTAERKQLAKERDELRAEAIKLGLVDPNAPTNAASQVF